MTLTDASTDYTDVQLAMLRSIGNVWEPRTRKGKKKGICRIYIPDLPLWAKGVPVSDEARVWFDLEEHAWFGEELAEELFERIIMRVQTVVNRRLAAGSVEDVGF